MKTLKSKPSSRRQWIAGVIFCSSGAVGAVDPAEVPLESSERIPKQGALGAVLIAKVESIAPLGEDEAAQSGRRIELNLAIESQVGLREEQKKLRLRCKGLARIFGAKNEEITGRVFLFRLLEKPVEPYDGKFEIWTILGGHP